MDVVNEVNKEIYNSQAISLCSINLNMCDAKESVLFVAESLVGIA